MPVRIRPPGPRTPKARLAAGLRVAQEVGQLSDQMIPRTQAISCRGNRGKQLRTDGSPGHNELPRSRSHREALALLTRTARAQPSRRRGRRRRDRRCSPDAATRRGAHTPRRGNKRSASRGQSRRACRHHRSEPVTGPKCRGAADLDAVRNCQALVEHDPLGRTGRAVPLDARQQLELEPSLRSVVPERGTRRDEERVSAGQALGDVADES